MIWSLHKFRHITENWILISNSNWTFSELYLYIYIYIYIYSVLSQLYILYIWNKSLCYFMTPTKEFVLSAYFWIVGDKIANFERMSEKWSLKSVFISVLWDEGKISLSYQFLKFLLIFKYYNFHAYELVCLLIILFWYSYWKAYLFWYSYWKISYSCFIFFWNEVANQFGHVEIS